MAGQAKPLAQTGSRGKCEATEHYTCVKMLCLSVLVKQQGHMQSVSSL